MMISPASPEALLIGLTVPAPVQVTATIACTSVPPSGRNSFWWTVAVNSAMGPILPRAAHLVRAEGAHQRDRDVVGTALGVRPRDEPVGQRERVVERKS